MLLQRVCVWTPCFLLLFFPPLLSKFHLCFPSRICEKYFQYISLNRFLVLILLPRHLLLTAFGNRILGLMDLGLTQYSCFNFLNAEAFVKNKKKIFLFIYLYAAAVALENQSLRFALESMKTNSEVYNSSSK